MTGTLALIDIFRLEGHSEISKKIRSVAEYFEDQLTLTEKWLLDAAGVLYFPELHITEDDPGLPSFLQSEDLGL